MKKLSGILCALLIVLASGCATQAPPAQYDFGSARALPMERPVALPSVRLAHVDAPTWIDDHLMHYRLAYANEQQVRPYASNRWNTPPSHLFGQRLKMRIAEAGGAVLSATDGGQAVPLLRIEMTDFIQVFDSASHSWARVAIRASLFNGRTLQVQKTFVRDLPAPTADAAGGARALADASDAVIGDLMLWLAAQSTRK